MTRELDDRNDNNKAHQTTLDFFFSHFSRYSRRLLLCSSPSGATARLLRRRDGVQKRAEDGNRRRPRAERRDGIFEHRDGREYDHRARGSVGPSSRRASVVVHIRSRVIHTKDNKDTNDDAAAYRMSTPSFAART